MGVFMSIQVGRAQAGVDNAADLFHEFVIDLNAPERQRLHQLRDRLRKPGHTDQDQVTTDIERGCFLGKAYGVVECVAGRH